MKKLIIANNYHRYETFNKLHFILVKGNRNIINVHHGIGKIIIYGNRNKVIISNEGNIKKLVIKGNKNGIFSPNSNSIKRISDSGRRNNFYIQNNLEYGEFDEYDSSEEEEETREEQIENSQSQINNEENNSDNNVDKFGPNNIESNNQMLEKDNESEIFMQSLKTERKRNIFPVTFARNVIKISGKIVNSDINDTLCELIDISFQKVSKEVKNENEKCVICYENFKEKEDVKMANCFHLFHCECIKNWIKSKDKSEEAPDCPVCRRKL